MNLLWKCIGNDFTFKMHWKWFHNKNALEMILLWKCTGKDFTIKLIGDYFAIKCIGNDFTIKMLEKGIFYIMHLR